MWGECCEDGGQSDLWISSGQALLRLSSVQRVTSSESTKRDNACRNPSWTQDLVPASARGLVTRLQAAWRETEKQGASSITTLKAILVRFLHRHLLSSKTPWSSCLLPLWPTHTRPQQTNGFAWGKLIWAHWYVEGYLVIM